MYGTLFKTCELLGSNLTHIYSTFLDWNFMKSRGYTFSVFYLECAFIIRLNNIVEGTNSAYLFAHVYCIGMGNCALDYIIPVLQWWNPPPNSKRDQSTSDYHSYRYQSYWDLSDLN